MVMVMIVICGVQVAGLHHGDHPCGGIPRGSQGGIQPALRPRGDDHIGSRQGDDVLGGGLKAVHILSGLAQDHKLDDPLSAACGVILHNGSGKIKACKARADDGRAVVVGGGGILAFTASRQCCGHGQSHSHAKQDHAESFHTLFPLLCNDRRSW